MGVSRDVISDEVWAVIGPLISVPKGSGRPPVDARTVVEATAWRFRAGTPWRDVPERLGNWNTLYTNPNRWPHSGGATALEHVQSQAHQAGELDWVTSIDSTMARVHQHGAPLTRAVGGIELQEIRSGAA